MTRKIEDEFDWFKWAGIEPKPFDELVSEARREGIPVFETDTEKDLYDRLLAFKSHKNNNKTIRINKAMMAVTILSAIVSIIATIMNLL